MWRNYLTVGLRALARNKTYAFINIFGLALGLAACLILLVYVRYETGYDEWLPDADQVHQVQSISTAPEDAASPFDQYVQGILTETFARDFPQIEAIARIDEARPIFLRDGQPSFAPMALADESFFRVLRLPFLHGDPETALAGTDSLVVSRTEAMNRFGRVDAIGETVTAVRRGEQYNLRVSGVFENLPRNSHLDFSLIGRLGDRDREECEWGCRASLVYLKLRPGAEAAAIERELSAWERRSVPPTDVGGQRRSVADQYDWRLVNVRDVHLSGAEGSLDRPGNDRTTLLTFAIVALLILGMAAVNFVNLATARASQRAREVALRKVLGATRRQLIAQFLAESLLVTAIAVAIALALVEIAMPRLATFLDLDLEARWFGAGGIIVAMAGLWAVVGLAGGIYPAFYLSRYQPAEVLKANKSSAEPHGTGLVRSILVVLQFAVSIALIACTFIVYSQTSFAQRSDLGFRRDGLIQIGNANRAQIAPQMETLMRQIERIDGVASVAGSNVAVAQEEMLAESVQVPGRAEPELVGFYSVSPEFFDTMGLRLLAGRALSRDFANDKAVVPYHLPDAIEPAQRAITARGANVVINELAARRFGFARPAEAIGQQVRVSMFGTGAELVPVTVVGVVADSRFRTVRDPVEPQMFFDRGIYNNLVVRFDSAAPEAVRRRVGEVWRQMASEVPFEADYADARLARLYAIDAARAKTFAGFAALAVVIACLGLFGLAAFTAERRTREIGIRKVFGARSRDIVKLLVWQFSKPVILANLIGAPVAWWVMRGWLNGFDARIDLGPGPFLIAGAIAFAIAIGTIAGHAIRVSRTNPIKALRYE